VARESAVRSVEKNVQFVNAPVLAAHFALHELRAQLANFLARRGDAGHRKFHFDFVWNGCPFAEMPAQKDLCEFLPVTLV